MYKNAKKGWYKLVNPEKFIKQQDDYMKSYNESTNSIEYKSSLELASFRFCDASPTVNRFSIEPFPIQYLKPTDNKVHRYFPDLYIEFNNGSKFLVEVKSFNETIAPKKPKKLTKKSENNYRRMVNTWVVNSAKWTAAKKFCSEKGIKFTFLTEREL